MFNINQIKEKPEIVLLIGIILFSFILDMYLLTRYNLSYGMDGPYYDLQVLSILQTGLPSSNDPPLAYYMLTPLVAITGNSFLGIKITMALIGSLMAIPAYFLTEIFSKKLKHASKVPALLGAFLITANVSYFQMLGDFMQNLVGVFFLLLLIYYTVKWLENSQKWRKYGVISIILLLCSIATHIYTGMVAVVVFVVLLGFSLLFKFYKNRRLPLFDLKICGILLITITSGLVILFTVYPVMFSKLTTVVSFFNGTNTVNNSSPMNSLSIAVFLTVPFILGVIATAKIFYNGLKQELSSGLKEKLTPESQYLESLLINKKTLLSWAYLALTALIIILSLVPSEYQNRFIMLAFVPVALLVPLGLKLVEEWFCHRYKNKNGLKTGLISIIAVLFALSSFYTAAGTFSEMGPSISSEQYNALLEIKAGNTSEKINDSGIMVVSEYHAGYWVDYVLDMPVESGDVSELQQQYPDKDLYQISLNLNESSASRDVSEYSWNPFLPYSFLWGGIDLDIFSAQSNGPPGQGDEKSHNNDSQKTPDQPQRSSTNSSEPPEMPNGTSNSLNFSRDNLMNSGFNGSGASTMMNQKIMDTGTLIFSWGGIKIYKL